jgi:hypothetical protein
VKCARTSHQRPKLTCRRLATTSRSTILGALSHSFARYGNTLAEGHVQSGRQSIKIFVDGPKQGFRSQHHGCKQRHIDGAAAQVLKLLVLYQCKRLFGRCDDGLLQLFEIAERALTRGRGRPARDFQHDQRMTQHPVRCQKRLKYAVGSAEMGNPDRRIREYGSQRWNLCGPPTRDRFHLARFAAESGKSLPRLNADEQLHCFAKQVGLVHSRIRDLERSVVEFIIDGDGGSQGQVLLHQ